MDTILNTNTENEGSQRTNLPSSSQEDCSQPLKFAMQDVQEHFKRASQTILHRIDEMGSRIDQLEFMLNDLISDVESSSPLKEKAYVKNEADRSETRTDDMAPTQGIEQVHK
ncbi:hypothetical protein OIY81_462 [Cryptosporidium canis]|uniref:Heat shock factor binding protein 1 n=1 Tax=Cryptosporidium canis TaxID=195482 RepID=A0ABQ8PCI5_9CRYT|nr:hypothetical protein OIY81_462 [Cryptosporidium canis]KAJ1614501.1 hypothetical protein OJ252_622 [Cryptosporidium canis]